MLVRRPGAVWTVQGAVTFVAHPDVGERLRLEGVAASIWRRFGSPRETTDMVDAVVADYSVSRDRAEEDVGCFVLALEEAGLVVDDDAPGRVAPG